MIRPGFIAEDVDGVVRLLNSESAPADVYDPDGLDALYQLEREHFWFKARQRLILNMVRGYLSPGARVIDLGAGTGAICRGLQDDGFSAAVGELHLNGLRYAARYGVEERYQLDLYDNPFLEEFEAACLFDVIEHLEDHDQVMRGIFNMLKPGGHVFLTVPAHQWLWSRADALSYHKRRYGRSELESLVNQAGFTLCDARYFYFLLVPLLWLRTLLHQDSGAPVTAEEIAGMAGSAEYEVHPVINSPLSALTALDAWCSRRLRWPAGGSIIAVGRKPEITP